MSRNGLKYRREKNKFICEGFDFKIEYSKPIIQAKDELGSLESENDILYYYYTFKVYKHIIVDYVDEDDPNYDENNDEIWKWKLVQDREVYDFPGILNFKYMLDYLSKPIDKEMCQKIPLRDNLGYEYQYSMTNANFLICDDIYELTKIYNYNGNVSYTLFVGGTYDIQGDLNACGIRCPYLNEDDIIQLKRCVDDFIDYSLKLQTKENKIYNKMCTNSFFIKENKLYSYEHIHKNRTINKNRIEKIFIENDNMKYDIREIEFKENGAFHTIEHNNVSIVQIKNNYIKLSDGSTILLGKLSEVYSNYKTNEPRLYYGIDEIAKDFYSILNNEEKEEFKNKTTDEILDKYYQAFINRTWMCREEHNFEKVIKNNNVENAKIYVRQAIEKIKNIYI